MSTPPTVGVDDDLAASQAGVTVRPADDESTRRVQVVYSLGGDDRWTQEQARKKARKQASKQDENGDGDEKHDIKQTKISKSKGTTFYY